MNLLKRLWCDELGLVVSAETMMVGTLGVIGAVAGIATTASAVNDELSQLAQAFRGFDQSYTVSGTSVSVVATCPPAHGCDETPSDLGALYSSGLIATTASSGFQQPDCQVDIETTRLQYQQLSGRTDPAAESEDASDRAATDSRIVEDVVVEPRSERLTIPAESY